MPDPLHPALVHLPIALAVVIPLLAIGLAVALWRDWLPRRAWVVVVVLQALLLGSSLLAMRTGEADEERVEDVVGESALETHASAAEVFTWAAGIALALTVVVLFTKAPAATRWVATAAAVATLVVLVLGVRVGHAGGQLVYAHGAASAYARGAGGNAPTGQVRGEGERAAAGGEAGEQDDD